MASQMLNFMTKNSSEAAVEMIDFNKDGIKFEVTTPEQGQDLSKFKI